jgi:hypothetical protein
VLSFLLMCSSLNHPSRCMLMCLMHDVCLGDAPGARSLAQVAMAWHYGPDHPYTVKQSKTLRATSSWKATRWGQTQAYKMGQHALVKGHYLGVAMLLHRGNASFCASFDGWDLITPWDEPPLPAQKKARSSSTGGSVHKRSNKPADLM